MMKNIILLIATILLTINCALRGPAPCYNIATTAEKYDDIGKATSYSFLSIFTWGDASLQAALKNGNILKVHHIDNENFNFLGIFGSYTTVIYGEKQPDYINSNQIKESKQIIKDIIVDSFYVEQMVFAIPPSYNGKIYVKLDRLIFESIEYNVNMHFLYNENIKIDLNLSKDIISIKTKSNNGNFKFIKNDRIQNSSQGKTILDSYISKYINQ
jgi:hypothetical protein